MDPVVKAWAAHDRKTQASTIRAVADWMVKASRDENPDNREIRVAVQRLAVRMVSMAHQIETGE